MIGFAYIYFQNIFAKPRRVCPFYVFIVGRNYEKYLCFFINNNQNTKLIPNPPGYTPNLHSYPLANK